MWLILPSPFRDVLLICFDFFFSSLLILLFEATPWNWRGSEVSGLLTLNLRGIFPVKAEACGQRPLAAGCQWGRKRKEKTTEEG